MRKLVYGALAAASLTLAVGIGSISASAAASKEPGVPEVTVDYANEILTVSTKTEQILVAYPKVKGEGADATVKVSSWDAYTGGSENTVIDLSTLNLTRDGNYVLIKGTISTKPLLIKLSKIDGKVKAKYNTKTGKISNGTADMAAADLAKYQYRTATGNWTDITEDAPLDLSSYQQTGAALYLRKAPAKADNGGNLVETIPEATETLGGYSYVALDKEFPGKELKVKIAKLANGPKVSVDYDAKKVTIPRGTEYAYNSEDNKFPADSSELTAALSGTWVQTSNKTSLALNTVEDVDGQLAATFVALRKPATDKKLASKITIYAYTAGAKLASDAVDSKKGEVQDITKLNATDGTKITLTPAGESNGIDDTKVTATYDKAKKTITIKNTGDNTYQVVLNSSAEAKDSALSATKAKVLKATTGTLTFKNVDDQYVYMRAAGDKKKEKFASNYAVVGKVVAPTEETEKE